ncbi:unnamed protein product [Soboliphyme baturini]|uniref:Cilia- and flagella-associated protein 206 n=1 Tax=Soboliphyme baturini TaxID=241478 RepID=A0A183IXI2_9BILA|nr:unnamed protein product [Soboliphyme baturini]
MNACISTLIEKVCREIRRFAFDKAKDLVDEFRSTFPVSAILTPEDSVRVSLLRCLSNLTIAEKGYMSLGFMVPKGFLRKESTTRPVYNLIRSDLSKIDNVILYEKLSTVGSGKGLSREEALACVEDILQKRAGSFHHPVISQLESSFILECEILIHLLRCHLSISQMTFLEPLHNLREAQSRLNAWISDTVDSEPMPQVWTYSLAYLFSSKRNLTCTG